MSSARPLNVAVLVGSLRRESLNRKTARAIAALSPATMRFTEVEIGDLPYYNDELEATPPAPWTRLRGQVAAADAVLFVTPEYNRSVPAVLKNAVDVCSRPRGAASLAGKPVGVISVSPGAIGGMGANHHLRQSLAGIGAAAMPTPEAYIGNAAALFDAQGTLVNDGTRDFLAGFVAAFDTWVRRFVPAA